ncbi:rRNA maturation RNase YbeY [candidate division WWE3 bacterium]|uniref:Endoribonuclease YbeY n=1 Tax=candidate division WWE3 bacterium TaxID=2053526 RepID=A0A955RQR4_UNCKA|nr:rRNA maturation RNase YbeY [candidate division WWE3 bacterium]
MTKKLSVGFSLTHDKSMKEINRKVFGSSSTTDVISLPLNESDAEKNVLGDLVVNVDEVKKNADKYGVSFIAELARVVAHGVLHLYGYDDATDKGKAAMRTIEDMVVKDVNVSDILNADD